MDAKEETTCTKAELFGAPAPADQVLWDMFTAAVRRTPDAVAITTLHPGKEQASSPFYQSQDTTDANDMDTRVFTYVQLESAAIRFANVLSEAGVKRNSIISTFVWNSVEWAISFWATVRLGATMAPLDPTMLDRDVELTYLLKLLKPDVVITTDSIDAAKFEECNQSDAYQPLLKMICYDEGSGAQNAWQGLPMRVAEASESQSNLDHPGKGSDPCIIYFTSGTTGRPKGCEKSYDGLVILSIQNDALGDLDASGKFLIQFANFRVTCLISAINTWLIGATVFFTRPGLDPDSFLRDVVSNEITHVLLVPSLVKAVELSPVSKSLRPTTIRCALIGGDTVKASDIKKCFEVLGAKLVYVGLGLTEGALPTVGSRIAAGESIPTTTGGMIGLRKVSKGHRIRVCAPEGGREPLERNEIGELHAGGVAFVRQYLEGRNPDSFYTDEKGMWYITGDQALIDDQGTTYILGRYKDIIKRSGIIVIPAVLEGCLNGVHGIEAHVIAYPNEQHGQVPVAIVNFWGNNGAINKQALKDLVLQQLGAENALEDVITLYELGMEAFPKNDNGKVEKRELLSRVSRLRSK